MVNVGGEPRMASKYSRIKCIHPACKRRERESRRAIYSELTEIPSVDPIDGVVTNPGFPVTGSPNQNTKRVLKNSLIWPPEPQMGATVRCFGRKRHEHSRASPTWVFRREGRPSNSMILVWLPILRMFLFNFSAR